LQQEFSPQRHKGAATVWISINSIDRYIQYLSQAAEIIAGYPLIPCRRAGTDFRFQNADEFTPPDHCLAKKVIGINIGRGGAR